MRRVGSIVVAALILMRGLVAFAIGFGDVSPGDWFAENVDVLVEAGIINGFGDGNFHPNETMQVDQFVKTMVVALGYELENGEDYWAQTYIDQAVELGILEDADRDDYGEAITRAEMSKLAVKVIESLEGDKNYQYDADSHDLLLRQITDRSEMINQEMENYISNAYELGVITGYPDRSFQPMGALKRSEACTVIRRVIDAAERKPFEYKEVVVELDERGQELYEEKWYHPFESGKDTDEGHVYTVEELRGLRETTILESGLKIRFDNLDRYGTWSIEYTIFTHSSVPNYGDVEVEKYQLQYILINVLNVDEKTVDFIIKHISKKEKLEDIVQTLSLEMSSGKQINVRGSDSDSYSFNIEGSGW